MKHTKCLPNGYTVTALGVYRRLYKDKTTKNKQESKNWEKALKICDYLLIDMIISSASKKSFRSILLICLFPCALDKVLTLFLFIMKSRQMYNNIL